MTSVRNVTGRTPSGGVRSKLIFMDETGRPVQESKAVRVEITEYDAQDKVICRTYGTIGAEPPQLQPKQQQDQDQVDPEHLKIFAGVWADLYGDKALSMLAHAIRFSHEQERQESLLLEDVSAPGQAATHQPVDLHPDVHAQLNKVKFTGIVTDKIGRKIRYEDGVRVAMGGAESKGGKYKFQLGTKTEPGSIKSVATKEFFEDHRQEAEKHVKAIKAGDHSAETAVNLARNLLQLDYAHLKELHGRLGGAGQQVAPSGKFLRQEVQDNLKKSLDGDDSWIKDLPQAVPLDDKGQPIQPTAEKPTETKEPEHGPQETSPQEKGAATNEPTPEQPDRGQQQPEPTAEPGTGGTERAGGVGDERQPTEPSKPVAGEAERPIAPAAGEKRDAGDQSAGERAAERIPTTKEEAFRRLDRYQRYFQQKAKQHTGQFGHAGHWSDVQNWMSLLRSHIDKVGAEEALKQLGDEVKASPESKDVTQYEGKAADMSYFCEAYLNRNGIVPITGNTDPAKRLISSQSPSFAPQARPDPYMVGDFAPKDPTFKNKLEEAKHLPGLESSEDIAHVMGKPVQHITPDVMKKMDEKYGEGKWIIKAYGDDAFAGHGVFFPQRVKQIQNQAQSEMWDSGQHLSKYGFEHLRDAEGRVVGIKHKDGEGYFFDTDKYKKTIQGDVRQWADRAAAAADNERGAALYDRDGKVSGKDFMVQPAFASVGISDEERAKGITGAEGGKGEGRVHIVTRNGKAEIIPHSTWIKGESLPVVFEDKNTKAMAEAALKAINALPESERQGQIYAPDIMPSQEGFKVVEANPANESGSSGYLGDSPFIVDSYVSSLTGREPAHVRFIRSLLSKKNKPTD